MKKTFMLLAVLVFTMAFSLPAFADVTPDPQRVLESSIVTNERSELLTALAEAKEDAVKKGEMKSFKGKFTALFDELNQLRAECKDLWTQLKAVNQNIKTALQSFKASLKDMDKEEAAKAVEALKAQLEPLRGQAKAIHEDMKAIRETKKAEWVKFRAAVKAQDEASASSALHNIISLKKQIIEKQKSLLLVKQNILHTI